MRLRLSATVRRMRACMCSLLLLWVSGTPHSAQSPIKRPPPALAMEPRLLVPALLNSHAFPRLVARTFSYTDTRRTRAPSLWRRKSETKKSYQRVNLPSPGSVSCPLHLFLQPSFFLSVSRCSPYRRALRSFSLRYCLRLVPERRAGAGFPRSTPFRTRWQRSTAPQGFRRSSRRRCVFGEEGREFSKEKERERGKGERGRRREEVKKTGEVEAQALSTALVYTAVQSKVTKGDEPRGLRDGGG